MLLLQDALVYLPETHPTMTGKPKMSRQATQGLCGSTTLQLFSQAAEHSTCSGPMCYCRGSPMCWSLGSPGEAVKPLPSPLHIKLEFVGWGKGIRVFSTSLSQGMSVCSQEKSPEGQRKCSKSPRILGGWAQGGSEDLHSRPAPW